VELVTSGKARAAFDLSQESESLKDRYGRTAYGFRCLLARRLVEAGCTFVTMVLENPMPGGNLPNYVSYNWDSHAVNCHIFNDAKVRFPLYDQAVTALIEDLYQRGLDRRVLLVVTGEFGRTPRIEYSVGTQTKVKQPGRDHWPQAQSIVVSGACQTGRVVGSTTAKAETPKDRPMTPNDLWATVFQHLEIDFNRTSFPDGSGRPMPMLPYGEAIGELI
ncbi:MAG TPA: DUF1501 domain-containing protein, partial [Urbifossiella sp.]